MLGFIKSDVHLFGLDAPHRVYPFGADPLGRCMLTRVLMGGQISMTVGLLGVAMSIVFGSIMGTASGYYGGLVDDVMQRIIEIIASFPLCPCGPPWPPPCPRARARSRPCTAISSSRSSFLW